MSREDDLAEAARTNPAMQPTLAWISKNGHWRLIESVKNDTSTFALRGPDGHFWDVVIGNTGITLMPAWHSTPIPVPKYVRRAIAHYCSSSNHTFVSVYNSAEYRARNGSFGRYEG